jgi:hypothetical protein
MGAIDHPLAAPADFLKQPVVAKFHLDSARLLSTIILIKRSETGSKQTHAAKSARRICKNGRTAFCAYALNFISLITQWRSSLHCTDRKLS